MPHETKTTLTSVSANFGIRDGLFSSRVTAPPRAPVSTCLESTCKDNYRHSAHQNYISGAIDR
jgi:hypothetical protein